MASKRSTKTLASSYPYLKQNRTSTHIHQPQIQHLLQQIVRQSAQRYTFPHLPVRIHQHPRTMGLLPHPQSHPARRRSRPSAPAGPAVPRSPAPLALAHIRVALGASHRGCAKVVFNQGVAGPRLYRIRPGTRYRDDAIFGDLVLLAKTCVNRCGGKRTRL